MIDIFTIICPYCQSTVFGKTYRISVEVTEAGVTGTPIDDPFWQQEDMRFQRAVRADEVVKAVQDALTAVPVFSYDNVKVRLEKFSYE